MERSFAREVALLAKGAGETFEGEGSLDMEPRQSAGPRLLRQGSNSDPAALARAAQRGLD